MKFIDGSHVPQSYLDTLQGMLDSACEAEEHFTLDELEQESISEREAQL